MSSSHNPAYSHLHGIECSAVALPAKDIVTFDGKESIEHIVKQLAAKNFLSAPITGENDECIGTIDLQDMISFLAMSLAPGVSQETAERNITMRTAAQVIKMSPRDTFTPLNPKDKCTLATELFATGIHRCPLTDSDNKLAGLLTQVDLLMELTLQLREGAAKNMGNATLESLGLGLSLPVEVSHEQSVGDTVSQLDGYQVSALPVVDNEGKLIGNFSVTNLINIWTDKDGTSAALSLSVEDYLKKHSPNSLTPLTAQRGDTFADTAAKMVEKQIHRLWVVDGDNKPVGVVSMTDVFKVVRDHVDATNQGVAKETRKAFGCVFRSLDGKVITVSSDKVVAADSGSDDNCLWNVEHMANSAIALKSSTGKYLCVDNKHVVGLSAEISSDCHFNLVESDTGAVALHDAHNGFIEVKGDKVTSHATKSSHPTKKQWLKMTKSFGKK